MSQARFKTAAKAGGSGGGGPDLLRLQRKIFTRWVNQKLARKHITVTDVVTDISDGNLLIQLMEVLSDRKYTGKMEKNFKMRVQKIDNINNALAFVWNCGVQTKVKPSAENLADGEERSVLGLIWAIMSQYLKIVDENGQQLNAKEALLEWCQSKTASYPEVKIENFTSSFHDGLALCAIIHKHRPHLIDWENLPRDDKKQCLQTAMDAAYEYFGLEKYMLPEDIPRLDENSMLIYISEYYYGIQQQRKLDLAANRIAKLIKTTKTNDDLKQEYVDKATQLLERVQKAADFLSDRTIDDALAKAQHRVDDFYTYKSEEKSVIANEYLNLEALYNNLAVKLVFNKRPEYTAPAGLDLRSIQSKISNLESLEQEKNVFLHKELNRQQTLAKVDIQHQTKYKKLVAWLGEKSAALAAREDIESASAAQLQISQLDAFKNERESLVRSGVGSLKELGATLTRENFENAQEVSGREKEIDKSFEEIEHLAEKKKNDLQRDLAREEEKERLRIQFARLAADFVNWTRDTAEVVGRDQDFGFTFEEVQAYAHTIGSNQNDIKAAADEKVNEYTKVLSTLAEHGVTQNPYTTTTAAHLGEAYEALKSAMDERTKRYENELARQVASDDVAKDFAKRAEDFSKTISEARHNITSHAGTLEEQLRDVDEAIAKNGDEQTNTLANLQESEKKIIAFNTHTNLTYKDVATQYEQYKAFLARKREALADQLLLSTRKGVTSEQVREIVESFAKFDEDKDGHLDKKELRQCLYSVGEEREMWEIEEIISKYGNKGTGLINAEGFREFMIKVFGDTDNKDQVLESLELLAKGDKFVKQEQIKSVMTPGDVDYFIASAPRDADDQNKFDYGGWVNDVFAR